MLGKRTIISFCQLLERQPREAILALFEKCNIEHPFWREYEDTLQFLRKTLTTARQEQVMDVVAEVVRLNGIYRYNAPLKWYYDQHWNDFKRCLMLDGYLIQGENYQTGYDIVAIDPTISAAPPIDDDLTTQLEASNLPQVVEIGRLLRNSADDFCRQPPDYNGSLTSARVALETIARDIAAERSTTHPGTFNAAKWGQVITYFRTSGLITTQEEEGLTGVYSFISPGAHIPVGMTEEEMVRLGRSLAASMAYFLIKRYRG